MEDTAAETPGAGTAAGRAAGQPRPAEPLPALTFGSGSAVSAAAAASSISDPEEGAARAVGNRGEKAM